MLITLIKKQVLSVAVMALMGIALIKGILRDAQREKNGVVSVHSEG